jgi:hypothetical protein
MKTQYIKNRSFQLFLLLFTSIWLGISPKTSAQNISFTQPDTANNLIADVSSQTSEAEPMSQTAADLTFDSTPLDPTLSNPVPTETVAQATVEPTPEEVGQSPSLRTEPVSPNELPFQPSKNLLQSARRYSPGITYLTPSAYGRSLGQFSVGGSFQSRVRYRSESDAFIGGGFGLGDPRKAVGLDVSIGIADVTTFERGTIGFKVHRRLPAQFAIAVGVENALTWGTIDAGISPYGVVSKGFQLREDPRMPFSQLYVSAGAGTGRYRSESDIVNRRDSVGVFGSVAVRVIEQVNFITEWSGQDLTLGVSVLPFPKVPLVFTPAVTDVTGTAGDGPRFSFAVGFGFTL